MAKQRVTYTWKLGTERDPESINQWLDAQSNIRDSLSFLVQVMQERFGNVDIRDIETSKELLQFMHEQGSKPKRRNKQETQATFEEDKQKETGNDEALEEEKEDEADDIFSGIDGNAIFTRR
ncbi:hypothetical protein EPH95_11150 [Salicibibacter halophilus]|uniref:Uncharacterized protein n=1 Tax=Salicibibacter halophilus TaxID=2502791 RepID=A0A514LII9_9BACI|nr:hypothetical protein [Salicibibacter halophilus]QDI91659.1 hypothetical protein EPH95_11150 [Salicibibacter halophilus]